MKYSVPSSGYRAPELGVLCWYDMEQAQLTLEGMKQGVRDSSCFLLVAPSLACSCPVHGQCVHEPQDPFEAGILPFDPSRVLEELQPLRDSHLPIPISIDLCE